MRVLIGCETSGVMRRAFSALGHDAWSCDLLPAEDGSNRHIVGDVRDLLGEGWDLLAVMHPPCTRLCNSGVRWLSVPPPGRTKAEMWAELDDGAALFSACWQAPIDRVAVENPIMHRHARERLPVDLPRPQIVQPWWFGEEAFKATGFYLRGLPPLYATDKLEPPAPGTADHKRWSAIHRAPPGPDRWKIRSRTFDGIAAACAEQWGGYAREDDGMRDDDFLRRKHAVTGDPVVAGIAFIALTAALLVVGAGIEWGWDAVLFGVQCLGLGAVFAIFTALLALIFCGALDR